MISVRIAKTFQPGPESAGFTLQIEFEAGPGITVLFGQSGSGKTLTLDSIAGFTVPETGRILLNDEILFDSGAHVALPPRDRHCGYVFQNYALFPHMTVRDNLKFGANSLPRLERHRRIQELLERFRLTELAGRYPRELSGGQKQRGAIARALIAQPKILLLDEPAQGLDRELRTELYSEIQHLRSLQIPVLLVTHGVEEVFTLADNVLVYEGGRILQRATPLELLRNPGSEAVTKLLGDYQIFDAEVLALDPGRQTSRMLFLGEELRGPYFSGCFLGDRIRVAVRTEELRIQTQPGDNRVRVQVRRLRERPQGMRVVAGTVKSGQELQIDISRAEWQSVCESGREPGTLWVEFPASVIRRV